MPWRLIITLILFGIIMAFVGFNLDNKADISFGFYTLRNIPVFVSLFVSFIAGALLMAPFTIGKRKKKDKQKKVKEADNAPSEDSVPNIDEKSGKGLPFFNKKKKNANETKP